MGEGENESISEEVNNSQEQQGVGGQIAEQAGQKVAEQGKKAVKKVAEKASKEVAKGAAKSSLLASLSTVLMYVALVLVIIFVIIGLIMFFVTMPGMVMDKLKGLFKALGNYVATFFGADSTEQIEPVQMYETLDYLEQMGWDIKSEGFLSGYVEDGGLTSNQITRIEDGEERDWEYDDETGVVRYDDGKIAYAESDFIYTYIMSDNYVYTLKNDNIATQSDPDANWFNKIVTGVATAWYKVRNFMFSPLFDALGISGGVIDKWGKGLIAVYYDKGLGRAEKLTNTGTLWNWDSIKIDSESKMLYIKKKSIFNDNNAMEYSLDGWTGRYGMPVEFLLSVHKATMMPDLAMYMVTQFPTEIALLLHKTGGSVEGGYKVGSKYILYEQFRKNVTGIETKESDNPVVKWFKKLFGDILEDWIASDGHLVQCAQDAGADVGDNNIDGCTCDLKDGYGDTDFNRLDKIGNKYYYAADVTDDQGNKIEGKTQGTEYKGKVETKKIVNKPCERCKGIANGIRTKLGSNQDWNFSTYVPYIAHVSDHWYRNVYFVVNKHSGDENYIGKLEKDNYTGGSINFVDNDYNYEAMVQDRWTLYETYTNDEKDKGTYKYNPEKAGEFIIFEIDEDGKYKKSGGEYVIFDGDFIDARPTMLFTKNGDKYEEYTGSRIDIKGDVYRYTSDGKYVKYTGDVAVSKKAVTIKSNDAERMDDLGWNNSTDSNVWSAYKSGSSSSQFEQLFTSEEISKEENQYTQHVMRNSYVKINLTSNVSQVGEGQRTETNPKIKKMFLQNNYFRYSGDETTAEIITDLREKIAEKRGKSESKYGAIKDDELNLYIQSATEKNIDGTAKKYYVKDFAGKVMLNQDSLNAFSMLENTHTLDSDYIYRDFKELIVELGYFTKEEVTGFTAKRVMQWVVPDIGSYLYPRRSLDKVENEYGTMVHSKIDLEANEKNTMKALIAELGNEVGPNGKPPEMKAGVNVDAAQSMQSDMLSANGGIDINEVGSISGAKSVKSVSLKTFLKTSREMCEYINEVGYDYCVSVKVGESDYRANCTCTEACKNNYAANKDGMWSCLKAAGGGCSCGRNHCKHLVHGNGCNLPKTFEASKTPGQQNLCCATLISWALQNVKVMPDSAHTDGASSLATWIKKNLDPEIIEKGQPLKKGDILCYEGHIDMVGDSLDIKFNGGHQVEKGSKEKDAMSSINKLDGWGDANYALRLDWGGATDPAKYEGYNGNEAVVSPVTGILLEYNTYKKEIDSLTGEEYRVNVDLLYGKDKNVDIEELKKVKTENTGAGNKKEEKGATVIDKVGYAKILVLDAEHYQKLESNTSNKWKNDSLVKIVETKVVEKNGKNELENTTKDTVIYKNLEDFTTDTYKDWSMLNKTVYGYKEFAELYNATGIAGNIVYIDGFVLEKPDENLPVSYEEVKEMDIEMEKELPKGEKLSLKSYDISPSSISGKTENKNAPPSRYEAGEVYKLPSKKAMEEAEADLDIKAQASTALAVNAKDSSGNSEKLYFIKEGTVLGRTMTDKELIEKIRVDSPENFDAFRPEVKKDANGDEIDNRRVMGNYLRIIMRDTDGTVVENVEDYMKLDEKIPPNELNYEFFFWSPYEGGAWGNYEKYIQEYKKGSTRDDVGQGPTIIAVDNDCQFSSVPWSIAVGIAQWTNNPGLNNIAGLCEYLGQFDASLSVLSEYAGKDAAFFNNNLDAFKEDWHSICSTPEGYAKMLEGQMTYAYEEEWLNSKNSYYKGIAQWAQTRPMALQGMIFSVMNWGNYSMPTGGKLLDPVVESKDDKTLLKDLTKNCIIYGKSVKIVGRWDSQAQLCQDIIDGKISEDELIEWIETKNILGVKPGYGEGVQYDGWE